MRIVLFYHSLVSDWNHGNAHFLRGICDELIDRGHQVTICEPWDSWSRTNLLADGGQRTLREFEKAYPRLRSRRYDPCSSDLAALVDGAQLVIAHEWNSPALIDRLSRLRPRRKGMRLLFHDTHHRSVTDRGGMSRYNLRNFDGVLAFGRVIQRIYQRLGWARRVWVWHEAADVRRFRPLPSRRNRGDVVWIGNWGDEERTAELHEFLLSPVRHLKLKARIYGVRYPRRALKWLQRSNIEYGGYLANFDVPRILKDYSLTVHVPRRPYVEALPGIPTIRPFEAMACGVPLVCSPWSDEEGLFRPGRDFLVAENGRRMREIMHHLIGDRQAARQMADEARGTILSRHTCGHRVDQLLEICRTLGIG